MSAYSQTVRAGCVAGLMWSLALPVAAQPTPLSVPSMATPFSASGAELTSPERAADVDDAPVPRRVKQPAPPAIARDPKQTSGSPILSAAEAGEDFLFQGEFMGYANAGGSPSSSGGTRYWGVQVVVVGEGTFAGLMYAGGLPGDGWNGEPPLTLAGVRKGDEVHFDSPVGKLIGTPGTVQVGGSLLRKFARQSPTMGLQPPREAVVLFDGRQPQGLKAARVTPEGWLEKGTETADAYGDFRLHLEFMLPYQPMAEGQGRGNSGLYIQSHYELQILDSFGKLSQFNDCGALYRQRPPAMNLCLPPLVWQTYDVWFHQPQFDAAGLKTANARITVKHNGVTIHDQVEITAKTGNGQPEGVEPLLTKLQDHKDPVRFRNVWLLTGRISPPSSPAVSPTAQTSTSHVSTSHVSSSPVAVCDNVACPAGECGSCAAGHCSYSPEASDRPVFEAYHYDPWVHPYDVMLPSRSAVGLRGPLYVPNRLGAYGEMYFDYDAR